MRIPEGGQKFVLFFALALPGLFLLNSFSSGGQKDVMNIRHSDVNGITFEITFPEPEIEPVTTDRESFARIRLGDLPFESRVGFPQMPLKVVNIGVPSHGDITFSYELAAKKSMTISMVAPVPTLEREGKLFPVDKMPDLKDFNWVYHPEAAIYKSEQPFPSAAVEIIHDAFLRQQRIISLRLNPVQYRPRSGTITFTRKILVKVTFPEITSVEQKQLDDASFEAIFEQMLMNAEVARSFRKPITPPKENLKTAKRGLHGNRDPINNYKIVLQDKGLYHLTGQDFLDFGLDLGSENPLWFKMYHKGEQIAITVSGEGDGVFDTTDYIEFFGQANTDQYSHDAVYWLTTGDSNSSSRITTRTSNPGSPQTPTTVERTDHFEQNLRWGGTMLEVTMDEDLFFQTYLQTGQAETYYFDLPNLDTGYGGMATVKVVVRGNSRNDYFTDDHKTVITLNNGTPQEFDWDGAIIYPAEFSLDHSELKETDNELVVYAPEPAPGILNNFFVNYFEITFHDTFVSENVPFEFGSEAGDYQFAISNFGENSGQVLDITDATNPVRIGSVWFTGGAGDYTLYFEDQPAGTTTYFCLGQSMLKFPLSVTFDPNSNLTDTSNSAQYLIITHEDFQDQADALADFHSNRGLITKVVTISDVYDEFNFGYVDPQALKDFLIYAYNSWSSPLLTYVVLLGDSTWDHKDYLGYGVQSYLPTSYFVTPSLGVTTNDHWFTRLTGGDDLADIHLGRFPVQTAAQAQAMVDKITSYASQRSTWKDNALFIADNTDAAGCFECATDEIIQQDLPATVNSETIYLSDYGSGTACRSDIISHLNSDTNSAPLVTYFGHGHLIYMASEQIFRVADIAALSNADHLPFFVNMTCYNGYFSYSNPTYECLGEVIVETATNGAIGFLASAGLTYIDNDSDLCDDFFPFLYADSNSRPGWAFTYAKNQAALLPLCPDEVRNTVFLGDPALELAISKPLVPALPVPGMLLLLILMSAGFILRTRN
ncbi:C25 family cysteine peptidase [candidate division CSSED10-310 bacterium]|uniref:C25 family cysteine peptidase n=1 Tax=candidate division CSSED10-310 bacterium TaxID=2855610 RepID=A0ABV6YSJ5_UNCC1